METSKGTPSNSASINLPNDNNNNSNSNSDKQNDQSRWSDVIAGFSIAGLLLPEAVAYSSIGNLPPQAGVIALFAGLLCYGLLGTSRFAIVSATSSSAAVLAAATAAIANGNAGLRLTLAIGLVLVSGIFFCWLRWRGWEVLPILSLSQFCVDSLLVWRLSLFLSNARAWLASNLRTAI